MGAKDKSRRRSIPRQPRAQASVEAILQAAEELLEADGYERASTNRIAARAGVNVSLLYRYFAGKEAIMAELIERAIAATERALSASLDASRGAPFETRMRALLDAVADHPPPGVHRALVEHVDVAKKRPHLDALRVRLGDRFRTFLGEHERELRKLGDPHAALFMLTHAVEAATHAAAFYRPRGVSRARALDELAEMVARYLRPEPT